MLYGLAALFAAFVLSIVFHQIERGQWSKEREKLLDRIQAHSLGEYKAFEAEENGEDDEKETIDETELL